MNFQDLWNKCFLLFLGSCVIKKKKNLCIRRDGNWKKGCVGCLYVFVCGMEGGRLSEKIRHQMLLYKQNIRKPHLSRLFALFNED